MCRDVICVREHFNTDFNHVVISDSMDSTLGENIIFIFTMHWLDKIKLVFRIQWSLLTDTKR